MQVISTSYYDNQGNRISKTYDTQKIVTKLSVEGMTDDFFDAVVIQWNDWKIGDPISKLYQVMKASKYGKKYLVLLDVGGKAHEVTKERGTFAATFVDTTISEEKYMTAKEQLDSIARVRIRD